MVFVGLDVDLGCCCKGRLEEINQNEIHWVLFLETTLYFHQSMYLDITHSMLFTIRLSIEFCRLSWNIFVLPQFKYWFTYYHENFPPVARYQKMAVYAPSVIRIVQDMILFHVKSTQATDLISESQHDITPTDS